MFIFQWMGRGAFYIYPWARTVIPSIRNNCQMINLISTINIRLEIKFSHEFWVTDDIQTLTWRGLFRVVHG